MANTLEQQIQANKYLMKGTPVLVGVSGGVDSVVLARVLHQNGFTIGIAHCHFGLRGEDADKDQKFTQQLAESLKVPFHSVKFETQTYADTRKVSIQMAARNLRYFWFEKLCKEKGYAQIIVGTHLTDNIETFLFNSVKGTGLSGLRGIKPVNGKVIRPFLKVTKEELYEYAEQMGWSWREDDSNQSIKYHRNKLRHKVLPVLKEINPGLEKTFQRNFEILGRTDAFVINQVDSIWNQWIDKGERGVRISIDAIKNHDFADVVLQYQLKEYGFNSVHVQNLLEAINGQPGSKISSKDFHLFIDREYVFLQKKRFFSEGLEYRITEFLGKIDAPLKLKFKDWYTDEVKFSGDARDAYFDFDKLDFPLTLRKWAEGDRLKPFGMKGEKKVSDLLIDIKMPNHEKENVWVVLSGDEICWVVGIRSSEKFKVTANTDRVYQITKEG